MSANADLNHTPPEDWQCYSDEGATGAGSSNLALGAYGPNAIDLYMEDSGDNNYFVGHRRWVLFQHSWVMGIGDVPGDATHQPASALWVFDGTTPPSTTSFIREPDGYIAWPPAGYIPYPVVFPRWSFSYPGANFSQAKVTMLNNGTNIPISQAPVNDGYGDNTIVWQPNTALPRPLGADQSYDVTITDVRIGTVQSRSFTYRVTLIDPARRTFIPLVNR